MTKTEQNRVLAWRLKVLREASAARRIPYSLGPIDRATIRSPASGLHVRIRRDDRLHWDDHADLHTPYSIPRRMQSFQLVGISPDPFKSLFELPDAELARLHARRVVATEKPGFPCRVSLVDAEVGEELLLLPYIHQPAASRYQASGPIFVRKGAEQPFLAVNEVPEYVRLRLMSLRAYDSAHMIVDADVCEGQSVVSVIARLFGDARVQYIHLHNAKRGCFSCLVRRA